MAHYGAKKKKTVNAEICRYPFPRSLDALEGIFPLDGSPKLPLFVNMNEISSGYGLATQTYSETVIKENFSKREGSGLTPGFRGSRCGS